MAIPYNATGLWPSANYGEAPRYASGIAGKVSVSRKDRERLRELSERVAAIAATRSARWRRRSRSFRETLTFPAIPLAYLGASP